MVFYVSICHIIPHKYVFEPLCTGFKGRQHIKPHFPKQPLSILPAFALPRPVQAIAFR